MSRPFRLLALSLALSATLGGGIAAAQTVIVRKVPAGSPVELVVNATTVGTATADAAGDASIPFDLSATTGQDQVDANIFLDVCDKLYRVVIVAQGMAAAAAEASCDRRAVGGLFLVRRITTLVVQVDSAIPSVLLVQGPYELGPQTPSRIWSGVPTGLVLFGGAGLASYSNAVALACGEVSPCSGDSAWGALTGGAEFWLSPFLAATGSFVKPAKLDISGDGSTFDFDSFTDAYVVTVGGKVGVPIGPVRLYGQAGGAYHRAVSATTQTMDEATITVNGQPQTIPGGTQAFELETQGWGWTFGGGVEAWLTPNFGFYGEAGRTGIKGNAVTGEGAIDDWLTSVTVGIRLGIGG